MRTPKAALDGPSKSEPQRRRCCSRKTAGQLTDWGAPAAPAEGVPATASARPSSAAATPCGSFASALCTGCISAFCAPFPAKWRSPADGGPRLSSEAHADRPKLGYDFAAAEGVVAGDGDVRGSGANHLARTLPSRAERPADSGPRGGQGCPFLQPAGRALALSPASVRIDRVARPKAHAWKACVPKGTVGSNPTRSAM